MIAAIILAAGSSTRMDLDATHGVLSRPLNGEAAPSERACREREKDAGSTNSSAIGATEDVVSGRLARPEGRGFVFRRPPSKALLPLGHELVLERVVRTVQQAGVREVLVVTGHGAPEVAAVAESLGATAVHNPDHLRGMFTSVQAGVRALAADVEAFFVLPMDCPLVRAEVLRELLHQRRQLGGAESAILHPTCCGRRGHPPLIAAHYRQELAAADEPDGLHGFLQRHAADEHDVEVQDLSILIDMDTPSDYRRVTDFAEAMDRARCETGDDRLDAGAQRPPRGADTHGADTRPLRATPEPPACGPTDLAATQGLTDDDSMYLLGLVQPAEERVRHCEAVAAVGTAIAEALHPHAPSLDIQLVRSGCLLHDIAKGSRRHAATAQILMERLGLPRVGEVVGAHMVIPEEHLAAAELTEEQLVYLADKLVVKDGVAGIDEREHRSLRKQLDNPDGYEAAKTRMEAARLIAGKVEALLRRPLEDVILDVIGNRPLRNDAASS